MERRGISPEIQTLLIFFFYRLLKQSRPESLVFETLEGTQMTGKMGSEKKTG